MNALNSPEARVPAVPKSVLKKGNTSFPDKVELLTPEKVVNKI